MPHTCIICDISFEQHINYMHLYEIRAHFKLRNPIIKQFKQSQTIASITLTKASSVDFQGFKQNRARKLNISGTKLVLQDDVQIGKYQINA